MACKPDPVTTRRVADDHSSGPAVADGLEQPTRTARGEKPWGLAAPRDPYSALLLAGLAMPPTLPPARWALTPPFHPCPRARVETRAVGRSLLCGAFPRVAPGGRYPPPSLPGVRTFLGPCSPRPSGHPRDGL